jgi:hypothetical protein
MNSPLAHSKTENTSKGPVGRSLTLSLVAIALALVYSLFALGINHFPDFKACQPVYVTLQELRNTSVTFDNQSQTTDSGAAAGSAAAAAAVTAPVQAQPSAGYSYADAQLVTTSIPYKLPAALGLPSDEWRPHIFSECASGMPRAYAPCLNYSNLLRGEELVYAGEQQRQRVRWKGFETLLYGSMHLICMVSSS